MIRILVCLLFLPVFACSQSFRFTHLNQYQGLSQNTVTAVLRDSEGLIWIGTQDGLNLFDGYKFTGYFQSAADTNTVSDNYIICLAEDHSGRIWIGTRNGLCYFDKKLARFFRFYSSPSERTDYHNAISSILILQNGDLVYHCKSGNIRLNLKEDQQQHLQIQIAAINDKSESEFYFEKSKTRISLNQNGIRGHSESGRELFSINWQSGKHNANLMHSDAEHFFYLDSLQLLLINLKETNPKPQSVFTLPLLPTCLLLDRQGMIWIGTQDGLYILTNPGESNQQVQLIRADQHNPFSLSSSQIQSLYESADGLIWIGNIGSGADIYDPLQNDFKVQLSGFSDGLSRGPVWMIHATDQYTLASSSSNIELIRAETIPSWWKFIPKNIFCTASFLDANGLLWMGTRSDGLKIMDTLNGRFSELKGAELLKGKTIMDIRPAPDNTIWICTIGGIFRTNAAHDEILPFSHPPGTNAEIKQSYFSAIRFDKEGNAWVGSNIGLMKFIHGNRNQYEIYQNNPGDTSSISYNILTDVCIDSKGRIWVSTISRGFSLFVSESKRFINYSTEHGLPNNTVYGMEEDASGNLWLSTNAGIVRFNPEEKTFLQFTSRDGLPSNEFVIHSHAKDANGRIYFGSADGLVSFHPDSLSRRTVFSRPALTQVIVNNTPASPDMLLRLSPDQRNISLEFTVTDYRFQDKIRYAYQLAGFDPEWRENPVSNRFAAYTNLPYGDYTFRVRYKTSGGQWSESYLEIPIHIQTPFWATWWFRISVLLSGILLLGFSIRYFAQIRLRKRLQELELARKIQNEKERISRDLHDNVGAQLTYIISSLDHVSYRLEQGKEIEPAQKKVEDLSEYARYTMQQLRESIWAINSESIRLSEILARLQEHIQIQSEYLEGIRIETERLGEDEWLPPAVSIEAFRILQEGISNAFKHAGADQLKLQIRNNENQIVFLLTDNGKGFDAEKGKAGHYGLSNMRQRAEQAGMKLTIESSGENGTRIQLEIDKGKLSKSGN